MACFLVPVAEAVAVTVVTKVLEKREKTSEIPALKSGGTKTVSESKLPFSRKLKWLSRLLWGGSVLLAFEHIWHGEVVPFFPFLTAMNSPEETAEMLREVSTVGVSMAALVTAVWIGMLIVSRIIEKREPKRAEESE